MVDYSNKGEVWYAMQTTYKRELKAKSYLDMRGVECFVPMTRESAKAKMHRSALKRDDVLKPAIHNLIFVKADLELLHSMKFHLSYLHNMLIEESGILRPIIVPTPQMEQFIKSMSSNSEQIMYVDVATLSLDKGTRVRIIGGAFEGCEGILTKVKGKRERRVVMNIEGIVAYGVAVDIELVETI